MACVSTGNHSTCKRSLKSPSQRRHCPPRVRTTCTWLTPSQGSSLPFKYNCIMMQHEFQTSCVLTSCSDDKLRPCGTTWNTTQPHEKDSRGDVVPEAQISRWRFLNVASFVSPSLRLSRCTLKSMPTANQIARHIFRTIRRLRFAQFLTFTITRAAPMMSSLLHNLGF